MERIKTLIREPALVIDFFETFVLMVVAFGVGLSGDQQNYIVAAIVALLGLLKAFMVHPFAVPALTDFARAALVVFASFGVGLTADQIALIVTGLGTLTTIIFTNRTVPLSSSRGNNPVVWSTLSADRINEGTLTSDKIRENTARTQPPNSN